MKTAFIKYQNKKDKENRNGYRKTRSMYRMRKAGCIYYKCTGWTCKKKNVR